LGFGTWAAFGAGRVLVGLDAGDVDFDTVEETGGAKTHTLTVDEMPSHTHTQAGSDNSAPLQFGNPH
jgi:microcystin-dependent protein